MPPACGAPIDGRPCVPGRGVCGNIRVVHRGITLHSSLCGWIRWMLVHYAFVIRFVQYTWIRPHVVPPSCAPSWVPSWLSWRAVHAGALKCCSAEAGFSALIGCGSTTVIGLVAFTGRSEYSLVSLRCSGCCAVNRVSHCRVRSLNYCVLCGASVIRCV